MLASLVVSIKTFFGDLSVAVSSMRRLYIDVRLRGLKSVIFVTNFVNR